MSGRSGARSSILVNDDEPVCPSARMPLYAAVERRKSDRMLEGFGAGEVHEFDTV